MKFAILAPGGIARSMATTVKGIKEIERYAVASRDLKRAEEFAAKWGFQKAYGSYEEMLSDPEVELVYVASPHSHHYSHAKMCLEHGKNVLVEKAFTVNACQAKELIELSHKKHLLLAKAIWTRYMPSRTIIDEVIASGIIGEITSVTANLGYPLRQIERMENPELAGGALLDLGVYPINFAQMVIHEKVEEIVTDAVMSPKGIDWINSITFRYPSGKLAILHSNMLSATDRLGVIYGEKGYIEAKNINNVEKLLIYSASGKLLETKKVPKQINGYEYEVLACIKAIKEGKTQCPEMPHAETLYIMELMDSIRAKWNMTYPCE